MLTLRHRRSRSTRRWISTARSWRARLGAVVAKSSTASSRPAGLRAIVHEARRLCPLRQRQGAGGRACAHGAKRRGRQDQSRTRRSGRSGFWRPCTRLISTATEYRRALVEVSRLPRLEGAKEDRRPHLNGPGGLFGFGLGRRYDCGNQEDFGAPMAGSNTWRRSEDPRLRWLALKKGPQGLSVSFTIQVGKDERTSEVTTVYYSPDRLPFALPIPDDASDIVFDAEPAVPERDHRRNRSTPTRDFFRKELSAPAGCRCRRRTPPRNGRTRNWTTRSQGALLLHSRERNGRSCCRCNAAMTARPMSKSRCRRLRERRPRGRTE